MQNSYLDLNLPNALDCLAEVFINRPISSYKIKRLNHVSIYSPFCMKYMEPIVLVSDTAYSIHITSPSGLDWIGLDT